MHYKNLILLSMLNFYIIFICYAQDFISIKSKSNLRAGPGQQYPINWTLKLPNMPVKVLEKNSTYTRVELYDGTRGWVWNATVSKKKFYIIIEDTYIFDKNHNKIALVKKNVLFNQVKCDVIISDKVYCKVAKDGIKGYLYKKSIWGTNQSTQ